MNTISMNPTKRSIAALQTFFGEEIRDFNREWHARDLRSGYTNLSDYWEWVAYQIEAGRQSIDEVIRFAMNMIYVNVRPLSTKPESAEDEDAVGFYNVAFGKNVAGFSRAKRAAIALDIFAARQGIESVDDFEIVAVDGAGHYIVPDDKHEDGSCGDFGTVELVGAAIRVTPWAPTLHVQAVGATSACVTLSPQFINRLRALRAVCQEQDLATVRAFLAPSAWKSEESRCPDVVAIDISKDDVWFNATQGDSTVATRAVPLETLFDILEEPAFNTEKLPSFCWNEGVLYFHTVSARGMIDRIADAEESSRDERRR
ncbi:hypothetical protein [Burkholderia sp. Ac-20365]|uniref:hypothetical protein n=1 Tax=Burkholderia sp. Ac-20365 TaxID=2703897 RepID=UPI00197B0D56|nr:hypothetical protein [Burkholderia sp. Ac-20365]MBN3761343.1 hypothetical protein [Burkholderia sp. Ac-20365]